jgi:hypothetical protein
MLGLFEGLLVRMIVTVSVLNFAIWYGIQKKPNQSKQLFLLGTIVLLISIAIQIWFVVVVRHEV